MTATVPFLLIAIAYLLWVVIGHLKAIEAHAQLDHAAKRRHEEYVQARLFHIQQAVDGKERDPLWVKPD